MAGQGDPKKTAKTTAVKAAPAGKKAAPGTVTPGPAMQSGPFRGIDFSDPKQAADAAKFAEILGAANLDPDTHSQMLRDYQLQALMAGGNKDTLAGLSQSFMPKILEAAQNGPTGKLSMADQLAAQSLLIPLAEQSAARAKQSSDWGAGLMQQYGGFLPAGLQGVAGNMADRQRAEGQQMAEAYRQAAYAQPGIAAMQMSRQLAAQQAQNQSGGNGSGTDFASALATALGK